MSIITKYIDCETASISSESLFRLLVFTDEDYDVQFRVYNNGVSNDSLQSLSRDPLSIDDIFRNLVVNDGNNNAALNIT